MKKKIIKKKIIKKSLLAKAVKAGTLRKKSEAEKLIAKYAKMTTEERRLHHAAINDGEYVWRQQDRAPWSKPQHIRPVGITPYGNYQDYNELEKTYKEKAVKNAGKNALALARSLDPKLEDKSLEDGSDENPILLTEDMEVDSFESDEEKTRKINELLKEVEDDLREAGCVGTPPDAVMRAINYADEISKIPVAPPAPVKYTLTAEELEKLFIETQKNIDAARAEQAQLACNPIPPPFQRVLRASIRDGLKSLFKRSE